MYNIYWARKKVSTQFIFPYNLGETKVLSIQQSLLDVTACTKKVSSEVSATMAIQRRPFSRLLRYAGDTEDVFST